MTDESRAWYYCPKCGAKTKHNNIIMKCSECDWEKSMEELYHAKGYHDKKSSIRCPLHGNFMKDGRCEACEKMATRRCFY